jgi:hypothetical protein
MNKKRKELRKDRTESIIEEEGLTKSLGTPGA